LVDFRDEGFEGFGFVADRREEFRDLFQAQRIQVETIAPELLYDFGLVEGHATYYQGSVYTE
jgi:hypothetical protein